MAVQGFGPNDFVALAKFAWSIYDNVRESRNNFGKLNLDVECLLVSVGALDKGHTQDLIADYIEADDGDTRQLEVRALRDGLNSVIMPFYALFDTKSAAFSSSNGTKSLRPVPKSGVSIYVHGASVDPIPPKERPWRRWAVTSWIQRLVVAFELKDMSELRSRFAVQAANLNLFLTRLTHSQLQKQTELLTLKLAEQSLLRNNFHYSLDLSEAEDDFRQDVASYVRYLFEGGKPFTDTELRHRKAETRHTVSTSGGPHRRSSSAGRVRNSRDRSRDRSRERWELERSRQHEVKKKMQQYAKSGSRERTNEGLLDDDARIKLASARERLALAEIKDDPVVLENDVTVESASFDDRPSSSARRASEQVIIPASRRPDVLTRSASYRLVCNACDRPILSDRAYYRCESGKCGKRNDSYDLCRNCYVDGHNCPGYERGVCLDMEKVIWTEVD